ncbi:DUF192 domain-containing protein [Oscillatoria sp. CS-180]|uniref:DUF192 domain-containing protein n=1 Tax=Oscillatoria sp. CS-180 TaxID=3021720 RepID=UPI00232DAB9E|nr:DUF192 domain-containing protein [Oscillatoria sp. CS-180]MDB9525583.1 DUF192 domain-containing protein [Oscillatoria sp. CS-180]
MIFKWSTEIASCVLITLVGITSCGTSALSEANSLPADVPAIAQKPQQEKRMSPLLSRQLDAQGQNLPITAAVELGGQRIGLEVALTSQQQAIGLMARESLADDHGMLFPFDPARRVSFWMKNVLIPLDMVFIYQGQIVDIASNVPPCESMPCPTYGPDQQIVDQVIELRGGLAGDLNLQVGDTVAIEWLNMPQTVND